MRFEDVTLDQQEYIRQIYSKYENNRSEAQRILSTHFGVTTRTIRNWVNYMGLLSDDADNGPRKVLIYDLETSRVLADVWWAHKQYVSHDQLMEEPRIITVAWKWLDEDKVYTDRWDDVRAENIAGYDVSGWGCDKGLTERFAKVYNEADMVVGVNNDNFDNRMLNQRCLVHRVSVNRFVKSFDIQKAHKRVFRTPSYSMKYQAKRMNITQKLGHEGLAMWRKAQYHGDPKVRKEAIDGMETYNIGDIITTQEMYLESLPYVDHKFPFGPFSGNPKWSCPTCGNTESLELVNHTTTKAGTVQYIMRCKDDGQMFKISNREYLNFIQSNMKQIFDL